jgi:hypothetical protein
VRREKVRQLTSEQIAQRVERRELGAGQAQAELQRRVREAPTQQIRQRAESAIQRLVPVSRIELIPEIKPEPRPVARDIKPFTTEKGTDLVEARRGGISEAKLREEGFTEPDIAAASKQSAAFDRLADFTDKQGNIDIDRALERGVSASTFRDAGVGQEDIDAAQTRQKLGQQVKPFTDREGNIDLIAARKAGISEKTFRELGVEQRSIDEANKTIKAQDALKPFIDKQGNIDAISARQRGISEAVLRDAGVEQSFIEKEIRPTLALVKKLQPFTNPDGTIRIDEVARKLSSKDLIDSAMGRQLLPDLAVAQKQNAALDKIKRVQGAVDKEGNVNLSAAVRQGISNQVIRDAGFSQADVKAANARVVAFNRLAPFAVRDEKTKEVGIDLVAAVSRRELLGGGVISPGAKRGVNDELLRNAGFTQSQIDEAKEVARQQNPAPKTKEWYGQIGKEIGVPIADALIPGIWVRNWSKYSNKDRAINIAFDAVMLVPLVGSAIKAGVKGAKAAKIGAGLKSTQRSLIKAQQAAQAPAEIAEVRAATKAAVPKEISERIPQSLQAARKTAKAEAQKAKLPKEITERTPRLQQAKTAVLNAAKSTTEDLRLTRAANKALREEVKAEKIFQKELKATFQAANKADKQARKLAPAEIKESKAQAKKAAKLTREALAKRAKGPAEIFERTPALIRAANTAVRSTRRAAEVTASLAQRIPGAKKAAASVRFTQRQAQRISDELKRQKRLADAPSEIQERISSINKAAVVSEKAAQKAAKAEQKAKEARHAANIAREAAEIHRVARRAELISAVRQLDASRRPPVVKVAPSEARVANANLIKSAAQIRNIVGKTTKDGKAAERAYLRLGASLQSGSASRAREAAKDLRDIARRNRLPGLEDRIKPFLTEKGSQQATTFFTRAAEKGADLPKPPPDVTRRVRSPDELAKRADDVLKADEPTKGLNVQKALPAPQISTATRQRQAQFSGMMTAIEAGRRPPPTGRPPKRRPGPEPEAPPGKPTTPERPERAPGAGAAVKERVKTETKTERRQRIAKKLATQVKVVNAPKVKPVERIIKAKPKPKVEAKPAVKPKEAEKVKPKEEARPKPKEKVRPKEEIKPKPKEETRPKPKEEVKPLPKEQVQTHTKTATETAVERSTKTQTQPAVRTATQTAVERAVQTATQRLVATKAQQAQAVAQKQATATKTVTAQAIAQRTATGLQTRVTTTVITTPTVTTKTPTKTTTTTTVRTPTRRKPPVKTPKIPKGVKPPHFDLPGDAEKQLKPGEFPRVVTWRQGVTNITVDIDQGIRTFDKAEGSGKGITPDETFKVLKKDRTRPKAKQFDQGVVRLNVTPRSVSFTRRKVT